MNLGKDVEFFIKLGVGALVLYLLASFVLNKVGDVAGNTAGDVTKSVSDAAQKFADAIGGIPGQLIQSVSAAIAAQNKAISDWWTGVIPDVSLANDYLVGTQLPGIGKEPGSNLRGFDNTGSPVLTPGGGFSGGGGDAF